MDSSQKQQDLYPILVSYPGIFDSLVTLYLAVLYNLLIRTLVDTQGFNVCLDFIPLRILSESRL